MENPEDLDLDDTEVLDRIIPKAAKKLVERNMIWFKPKKQTPYTGWWVRFYEDDAIEWLVYFKDGIVNGPCGIWRNNGQRCPLGDESVLKFIIQTHGLGRYLLPDPIEATKTEKFMESIKGGGRTIKAKPD